MTKDTGGPAFPVAFQELDRQGMPCAQAQFETGMTLRDYFAAKALEGLIGSGPEAVVHTDKGVLQVPGRVAYPKIAYEYADAMLAERDNG